MQPDTQNRNELKIDLAKANIQDSVSIVIVHKDKPEYLNICLQSIAVIQSTIIMKLLLLIMLADQKLRHSLMILKRMSKLFVMTRIFILAQQLILIQTC